VGIVPTAGPVGGVAAECGVCPVTTTVSRALCALTVASIVRHVRPRSNPDQILNYPLSIRAVTRVGNRYIPRERIARHRLSPRLQRIHHFLAVLSLLRTVEGNVRQHTTMRQYQFTADGSIPQSQLADFRKDMAELGDQTLVFADEAMFRRSALPRRGNPASLSSWGFL
jgi:hypothetical protein